MSSNIQTIRFPRQETKDEHGKPVARARSLRHQGMLQDQLRRSQRAPWCPSFSLAFRILLFIRFAAAMYSNIQDCDEVFNFWEPLHYLDRGSGFQTWETSPLYAIRSYAYILLHLPPAKIAAWLLGPEKRPVFFAVRIYLAFFCTFCECKMYRMVLEKVNYRVARYMFFMMATSAGMWNASTAFLPSSFAMYLVTLAFGFAAEPASLVNQKRTLVVTLLYATAAIVGWPFSLAIAIPFVIEELFLYAGDIVPRQDRHKWMMSRWLRLFRSGALAGLIFLPVIALDSVAYGRLSVVSWNIVKYNILSSSSGRGPELYGAEPWNFYVNNLILNFNGVWILAMLSLPALAITSIVDPKRVGIVKGGPERSSQFTILGMRLVPLYIWFVILTMQAHKEERFMFPVYGLICFNAAVTLYLVRGWLEVGYIKMTNSSYKASQSSAFSRMTMGVILGCSLLSISRIIGNWSYYHAPMSVVFRFEHEELPRLLNATGHIRLPSQEEKERGERVDLSAVPGLGLKLCIGKEWHRFPGSYLIPEGVKVDWIKSEFDGLLPGHFVGNSKERSGLLFWWTRDGTRAIPEGMNDLNHEEPMHYTDVSTCDYLMDLDFPVHPVTSEHEPRYMEEGGWEEVLCVPFLDGRHSRMVTRTLWMPGQWWQEGNEWGKYCVLKREEWRGAYVE